MKKIAFVYWVMLAWGVPAMAELPEGKARHYVIGFDDTEVEVLAEDGGVDYLAVEDIGEPPLPILEDDGRGFVRVQTRDGGMVWLGRSYLQTDEQVEVPSCHDARLAKASDRTMASARGVGEACK